MAMSKGAKVAVGAGVVGLFVTVIGLLATRKSGAAAPPEEPEEGMANLYGRVTDSETGNGIAGVRVTTTGAITETDSAGNYAALDIPPGDWGVRFEKDGYETKELTVSILEGNNELNVQMVPTGGAPPEENVQISNLILSPTQLTTARHEYETGLGLGHWGDPFTINLTFSNPFDFDVWVKPDYAFGHLTGEALKFEDTTLKGFTAEERLYFRLLLQSEYIEGDYSYTTAWQKLYDAKGQNVGSNQGFVYDPDGVPRAGDERWLKVPAGQAITLVKDGHLGDDLSTKAWQCTTCGEIITGSVEAHYEDEHPGIEVNCWSWGGYSGCYIVDTSENAAVQVDVPAAGVEGFYDVCAVAWRAIYFVYDPGCGQTRVGGQIVTLNWRLEELPPIVKVVPNMLEIVAP